jgi:hypothetical protein
VPPYPNDLQLDDYDVSFVLVRTIRTSCIIKSPNQINLIIKFKVVISTVQTRGKSLNCLSNQFSVIHQTPHVAVFKWP